MDADDSNGGAQRSGSTEVVLRKYIGISIIQSGKPVAFVGSAQRDLLRLPPAAQERFGTELDLVRLGKDPIHWKPMKTIGPSVREIRVHVGRAFRAIYVASFPEAVYVLHVFEKKSQRTAQSDIQLARARLRRVRSSRMEDK